MEWDRLMNTKFRAEIAKKRDHLGNLGGRMSNLNKTWYEDVVWVVLDRAKIKLHARVKMKMNNLVP
jgi:hypothetical protein